MRAPVVNISRIEGSGASNEPLPEGGFSVFVDRDDSVAVVVVQGELDLASVDELRAALREAEEAADKLVLDLRGLEFMDTSGLSLVIEQDKRTVDAGKRFVVVRPPAPVQRIFDMVGVTKRLTLVEHPAEAVE